MSTIQAIYRTTYDATLPWLLVWDDGKYTVASSLVAKDWISAGAVHPDMTLVYDVNTAWAPGTNLLRRLPTSAVPVATMPPTLPPNATFSARATFNQLCVIADLLRIQIEEARTRE